MTADEITIGRYPAMSFDAYRHVPAINASSLRVLFTASPAHAITERESTASMSFGAALHCLTLEPEQFPARYYLHRKFNRTRNDDKAAIASLAQANPGRDGIVEADYHDMLRVAASIREHPIAGPMIKESTHEESLVWREEHGLCKARMDMRGPNWGADLKSTRNANPAAFSWIVRKSRRGDEYSNLWIQAAWYARGCWALGLKLDEFHFIAVESGAPNGISVHTIERADLESSQQTLDELVARWAECLRTANFPAYPAIRNVISLEEGANE